MKRVGDLIQAYDDIPSLIDNDMVYERVKKNYSLCEKSLEAME